MGKAGGGGAAREATNFIMMGWVTITFCPLNNLGLPRKQERVGEKGSLSGGNRLIFNYETRLPRTDTLSHTSSLLQSTTECQHGAPLMRGAQFPYAQVRFFGDIAESSPPPPTHTHTHTQSRHRLWVKSGRHSGLIWLTSIGSHQQGGKSLSCIF